MIKILKIKLILIILLMESSNLAIAKEKLAIIFDGGGFRTSMYIGIYNAFKDHQINPDVVIGTCGGSIAAAIVHVIPDKESQILFLQSKEFHNLLTEITLTKYKSIEKSLLLVKDFYLKYKARRMIPNLFDIYLMNVPDFKIASLDVGFAPIDHQTVIIAAKVLFDRNDVDRKRQKGESLFQETIFTDKSLNLNLDNFEAPLSKYKNSNVAPNVEIITNATLFESSRLSISDPFYMKPGSFNQDRYITGAIDLFPIELAQMVAEKIIIALPDKFNFIDQGAIFASFNFSANKRIKDVFSKKIDYLVDVKNFPTSLRIDPKLNYKQKEVENRIPKDIEIYRKHVMEEYAYGYAQALKIINLQE